MRITSPSAVAVAHDEDVGSHARARRHRQDGEPRRARDDRPLDEGTLEQLVVTAHADEPDDRVRLMGHVEHHDIDHAVREVKVYVRCSSRQDC